MAHLTYFDTIEEYNAYINSEDFVSPNVSYCAEADAVFMNEEFVPSMSAVFNTVYESSMLKIGYTTNGIKAIRVDGQLVGNISSVYYTVKSAGNHTVEYQFRNQNAIPNKLFYDITGITSVDLSNINYIGDGNFYGSTIPFGDLVINGSIGNGCFSGAYGLTSIVVNGNIGDNNFGGATALTSIRVSGNVGNGNNGSNSLTDLYVGGDMIGGGNFGGVSTLTAVTINGNVSGGNFGGCNNIKTLKVGGSVTGGGNFNSSGSKYETIEIGGNIDSGNYLICNNNLTTNITISGNANGGGTSIYSGDTLTISGDCGNPSINYWKRVVIGGSITGSGLSFLGTQNVTVMGDLSGNGITWAQDANMPGQSFTITGSITKSYCFYDILLPVPMINVGGSISDACFMNVNITGTTAYTVHGSVGASSFVNISGLTDVTVEGDVRPNSFTRTGSTATNSITSLTLSQACTSYGAYGDPSTASITKLTVLATTPPEFSNELPGTVDIYVPANLVDTYKAASGWSTYASQIQAISS
jgi:hypothetical protein